MKRGARILAGLACVALLLISWVMAINVRSDEDKQLELIAQADSYLKDEIYILAAPLLEEAIGYQTEHTLAAEETLKDVYLHLIDQTGYSKKYTNLLDKQMDRTGASVEVFREAAEYYLGLGKESDAFTVLTKGIAATGSEELVRLYESVRYSYKMGRFAYDDVTAFYNGAIQVKLEDHWGLATASGLVIPCEYDHISTYSSAKAFVSKDGVISAVDIANNRVLLLHGEATDFGNYAQDRVALLTSDGWKVASGSLAMGSITFDALGTYSNGGVAAKEKGGKWGVLDGTGGAWLVEPLYDGIVCDELGRCYAQNAIFVQESGGVRLVVGGERVGELYEDARPFADGWAAVKKNGKWGFIDTQGTVQIAYQFDDALSFGQHLAAVKVDGAWGYVSLYGEVVIEPAFLEAKSFSDGSAPVLTESGWKFITLVEYRKSGGGLL